MANNVPIGQLPAANQINDADMFALEQAGEAKKLFGSLLKNYVENATEEAVEPYVNRAETAAESSESSATHASNKANEAASSATAASNHASDALNYKNAAENSASSANSDAAAAAESATEAKDEADRAEVYVNSIKGFALINSSQNDPDNAVFDAVLNDAINASVLSTVIKGRTVPWNQLANLSPTTDTRNGISIVRGTDTVTATGTCTTSFNYSINYIDIVVGHKYLLANCPQPMPISAVNQPSLQFYLSGSSPVITIMENGTDNYAIGEFSISGHALIRQRFENGQTYDLKIMPMVIDLTLCGFTSSETTDVATLKTAWLKKYGTPLPQYIPYDAGSLKNVNGTFRLTGRNLWDEEWEVGTIDSSTGQNSSSSSRIRSKGYIAVSPNTNYYAFIRDLGGNHIGIRYYDAEKNFLGANSPGTSSHIFTTYENCAYIRLTTSATYGNTYNNDICINLSDASINGQYFPHYNGGSIDCSTAPLNGFGTAQDEADYAKGTRIDMCDIYTFDGTEEWQYITAFANPAFRLDGTRFTSAIQNAKAGMQFVFDGNYRNVGSQRQWSDIPALGNNIIGVVDSAVGILIRDDTFTDASAFALSLVGKKICYELATPVTSSITPQPLTTQYGYNVLRPTSGDVQSAGVSVDYIGNITTAIADLDRRVTALEQA